MFELQKLLRPHIAAIKPYSSARDEYSGSDGVFLDANENPFGSITQEAFNRYPDPYQSALKVEIAKIKNVSPQQIFLGNGSDEAIDLLFRAFCRPSIDEVIILPPTYGMYEVSANINDVKLKKVNLTADFQIDLNGILEAISANTKIIFFCSPNNPSGNKLKRQDMLSILAQFEGLVVVDEAYIDFSDEPSFTTELAKYPNLLVMQTFSKAWGLASLRLGMAFASVEIIKILNLIKPPYNISGLTQETVLAAIGNVSAKDQMVKSLLVERANLQESLAAISYVQKIYPSDANFLLVKMKDARKVYEYLIDHLIIVRDRSKVVLCDDCLRISVGTPAENQHLIQIMKKFQA
ncbi:histidinol-phosphate transaminase [Penaeicola halotolerans]|uniref:histidinol-phosphate transaminase n=1 Tax=Penaeicola halotolerans TaxID=2793196 RepID=UPI001CF872F0|nr:histidinol-phosphate transaminase [Penaeicola halotolerans]